MPQYQRSPFLQNILETAQIIKTGAEEERERKLEKEMARNSFLQKMAMQRDEQGFKREQEQSKEEAGMREKKFTAKMGLLEQLAKSGDYDPESKKSVLGAMTNLISGSEDIPFDTGKLQAKTVPVPEEMREVFKGLVPAEVPEYKMQSLTDAYEAITRGQTQKAQVRYYGARAEAEKPELITEDIEGIGKVSGKDWSTIMREKRQQRQTELSEIDTEMKQNEYEADQIREILGSDDPKDLAKQFGTTPEALVQKLNELNNERNELKRQYNEVRRQKSSIEKEKESATDGKKKIDWID